MHFVCILRCADNALYVGETPNPAARLAKHNEGSASHFTAKRRPVSLAYAEEHADRRAALLRDRQVKRWSRAKKEALIEGDLDDDELNTEAALSGTTSFSPCCLSLFMAGW
jgi:putative endonuclease